MMTGWPVPKIVVSECLGFAHCRYDGSIIPDRIVSALQSHVSFVPVCPEERIGLGTPRPPIRLVLSGDAVRLLQPDTGQDLTEAMQEFSRAFLAALSQIDGFILKNRSPSCAVRDAKLYPGEGRKASAGQRPGLFGEAVLQTFPDLPVLDEGRLTNRHIREHFLTAVFALARLREVVSTGQMGKLVDFHSRYKLILMAYHQTQMRKLGRLVANPERLPVAEVMARYQAGFRAAMLRPPRRPSVINVLMHAFGYFSKQLSPAEKAHFLDLLVDYRAGLVPLSTPTGVLQSWMVRFSQPYLEGQAFFRPFPEALLTALDSGKGRVAGS
ncbi:MAG: DUF1722 domain-containing protein [Chloroflexi bacterium]|nr:MAG: DUF1722 domain-containing protein [Chloroflexota bacterium]